MCVSWFRTPIKQIPPPAQDPHGTQIIEDGKHVRGRPTQILRLIFF